MARRRRTRRGRSLVGLDFSSFDQRRASRALTPALIAVFIAAIGLVALRTEVLKLRYELAALHERERTLDARQRDLTVHMRQLRDPRRLAERAAALGFRRPERLIDLRTALAADARFANLPAPADTEIHP